MMLIDRHFTKEGSGIFDEVKWKEHTVHIEDKDGRVVYHQDKVLFPDFWSDQSVQVVASKYFGLIGTQREDSLGEMIGRVVSKITKEGIDAGYFSLEEANIFYDELCYLILHQYATFNSPVWFNIGILDRPQQCSACFLVQVEDSMEGILDWYKTEGLIFKGGSGSGVNISTLRATGEPLSKGGTSSGPLSFMKAADASSGAIKSGGATRRSARMVLMNADHPDIMEFIKSKSVEETKARALIAQGFDGSFEGEVYNTLAYQNANHSVVIPDEFMRSLKEGQSQWPLMEVVSGNTRTWIQPASLFEALAEATWTCGDPGVFFYDTINTMHTCKTDGDIHTCNPCQRDDSPFLTPYGIRQMKDIGEGSIIWSGNRWTKVVRKWHTGVKPVWRYYTRAGIFEGTMNHRIVQSGEKIPIGKAEAIDTVVGPSPTIESLDTQSVLDGLVFGDGSAKVTNQGRNFYVGLYIGTKDKCYFESEVKDYIREKPFDRKFHLVKTTLSVEELPKTYERDIPERFYFGDAKVVASFLRGLYSANGSVLKAGRITLKASSFVVVSKVQQMLSSLGIHSYYTINRSQDVRFQNGTYTSRQSYDVNITSDKDKFRSLIGFLHPYKQRRLDWICRHVVSGSKPAKATYEIVEKEYLGMFPVYDLTVEAMEHTYWSGGLHVSNCSEYFFLDWTSCNLATLNLMKFKDKSMSYKGMDTPDDLFFDKKAFRQAVRTMTLAQDILISFADFPIEKIQTETRKYRTIGLNFANLGAYLMSEGIPYDSVKARHFASHVSSLMTVYAYQMSAEMSRDFGAFTRYSANYLHVLDVLRQHMHHATARAPQTVYEWQALIDDTLLYGLRNAQVTLAAPTGTVSFMLGCDTTGVEPAYGLLSYKHLSGGGVMTLVNESVKSSLETLHYGTEAIEQGMAYLRNGELGAFFNMLDPADWSVFDCAMTHNVETGMGFLQPSAHIHMVAAIQPFLSGGVSKTVNVPQNTSVEEIEALYLLAWKEGLKSVSIYRDGSKQAQPIVVGKVKERKSAPVRRRLPDERPALNHKFSVGGLEGYITVGLYDDGSPGEVFLTVSKQGTTISGLTDGFATLLSVALQYGVPLEDLIRKFSYMRFEPMGFTNNPNIHLSTSVLDYLFRWLQQKFLPDAIENIPKGFIDSMKVDGTQVTVYDSPVCTECGGQTIRAGTCYTCTVCYTSQGCS